MASDRLPFQPRPSMDTLLEQVRTLNATVTRMESGLAQVDRQIREGGYINRTEFLAALDKKVDMAGRYWFVEKLVVGGAGLILVSVLGAVLLLVGLGR